MNSCEILLLTQEDVIKAGGLDMSLVIPTMEEVFKLHAKKDYVLPSKSVLRWGDPNSENTRGRINSMPGWIGGNINSVGIKWISSAPRNPRKYNLPRASAVIILNEPETLLPFAIMDGTVISAARTGAATGVGAKYLAKKDSKVLGLIGAGVQNYTQLLAVNHIYPNLEEIKVFDINKDKSKTFAMKISEEIGKRIKVVDSAWEAVKDSDIYITATVTNEPIIKSNWIDKGVFYSHVGGHECEFSAISKFDKKIVDDWNEVKHRGVGSIALMFKENLIDNLSIYGELGEIVSGVKTGRINDDESIYMTTVGMGIEDVALASKILERAKEMGLGKTFRLWEIPFAI